MQNAQANFISSEFFVHFTKLSIAKSLYFLIIFCIMLLNTWSNKAEVCFFFLR